MPHPPSAATLKVDYLPRLAGIRLFPVDPFAPFAKHRFRATILDARGAIRVSQLLSKGRP